MLSGAVLSLAAALAISPVQERTWPSSGGFDVIQLDDSCLISGKYPFDGRAPVEISVIWDGETPQLLITSMDWSNRQGETYQIDYILGDRAWSGEAAGVVLGYVDKGFVASFEPDFLDGFAEASSLLVMTGETVITHISLTGSAAAVSTLRRCADHVRRANAEQARRERRWDYIAPDPFAPPPAAPGADSAPAEITAPEWTRSPQPEFPERAASRGIAKGRVEMLCTAGANGSLTNCSIVSEDPAGAGFGQAVLRSLSRARLSPASAVAGARVRFTVPFDAP